MPVTSFEIGAIFAIDDQASGVLSTIGRAFEGLAGQVAALKDEFATIGDNAFPGLKASVDVAFTEVGRLITQAGELAAAWRTAGDAMRGAGGGGPGGGGGGGGRRRPGEDPDMPGGRNDRAYANAVNQDYDAVMRQVRQEAEAANRNPGWGMRGEGLYGPPDRPGEGPNDRAYANAVNADYDRVARRLARNQAERERGFYGPPEAWEATRNVGTGGIGGGGGGGRGGGAHWHGRMEPVPGAGIYGGADIAGALAVYSGEHAAMTEDRALAQALIEMGYHPSDPNFPILLEQLRGRVVAGTSGTIYSESKGAGVLPGTAGQFGAVFGTPEERRENFESALPTMLKFSEVAEQFHRGSLQESMSAAIGYAHMTRRYGGPELEHGLDALLTLALATGDSVAQEQTTLKYSLPLGMAAGLSAEETAGLTGFFEIMGFKGTTAGTGVGQLLMGLTKTGGPMNAHQTQQQHALEKEFQGALNLDPKALHAVHASRGNAHTQALRDLGLLDSHDKLSEEVAPGGKINLQSLLTHIEGYLTTHTKVEGLGTLASAFTVRGSRQAALLEDPAVIDKLNVFLDSMINHPLSVTGMQGELQTRALQQGEQALANLANTGNILATTTLPMLGESFVGLNYALQGMNTFLKANPVIAATAGFAALATGIGALSVTVAHLTGLGTGLAGAFSAMGGALVPFIPVAAAMAGAGIYSAEKHAPILDDLGRQIGNAGNPIDPEHHGGLSPSGKLLPGYVKVPNGDIDNPTLRQYMPGPSIAGGSGLPLAPDRHVGNPITIAITNYISGILTDDAVKMMMDKLTSALKSAMTASVGGGQGSIMSGYGMGAGAP